MSFNSCLVLISTIESHDHEPDVLNTGPFPELDNVNRIRIGVNIVWNGKRRRMIWPCLEGDFQRVRLINVVLLSSFSKSNKRNLNKNWNVYIFVIISTFQLLPIMKPVFEKIPLLTSHRFERPLYYFYLIYCESIKESERFRGTLLWNRKNFWV